jgi:hypothetical protein
MSTVPSGSGGRKTVVVVGSMGGLVMVVGNVALSVVVCLTVVTVVVVGVVVGFGLVVALVVMVLGPPSPPSVFEPNLQCQPVKGANNQEESHWSHACSLQANKRGNQWHSSSVHFGRKRARTFGTCFEWCRAEITCNRACCVHAVIPAARWEVLLLYPIRLHNVSTRALLAVAADSGTCVCA